MTNRPAAPGMSSTLPTTQVPNQASAAPADDIDTRLLFPDNPLRRKPQDTDSTEAAPAAAPPVADEPTSPRLGTPPWELDKAETSPATGSASPPVGSAGSQFGSSPAPFAPPMNQFGAPATASGFGGGQFGSVTPGFGAPTRPAARAGTVSAKVIVTVLGIVVTLVLGAVFGIGRLGFLRAAPELPATLDGLAVNPELKKAVLQAYQGQLPDGFLTSDRVNLGLYGSETDGRLIVAAVIARGTSEAEGRAVFTRAHISDISTFDEGVCGGRTGPNGGYTMCFADGFFTSAMVMSFSNSGPPDAAHVMALTEQLRTSS